MGDEDDEHAKAAKEIEAKVTLLLGRRHVTRP
jgi:hypothetical protein